MNIAVELHKFNNIVFSEKEHRYTINGNDAISVTTLLNIYKEEYCHLSKKIKKAQTRVHIYINRREYW